MVVAFPSLPNTFRADDTRFTAESADAFATTKTLTTSAFSLGVIVALCLYLDRLLHQPRGAEDRAELVAITCTAICIGCVQIILSAILGVAKLTYSFPLYNEFMQKALEATLDTTADADLRSLAHAMAVQLTYKTDLPQVWMTFKRDLERLMDRAQVTVEDIRVFKEICANLLTAEKFENTREQLEKFYKRDKYRRDDPQNQRKHSRNPSPEMVNQPERPRLHRIATELISEEVLINIQNGGNIDANPRQNFVIPPKVEGIMFIKGWVTSVNRVLFATTIIQAVLIGFLGGKGFGLPK